MLKQSLLVAAVTAGLFHLALTAALAQATPAAQAAADVNLAMGNLVDLVGQQARAYAAKKR